MPITQFAEHILSPFIDNVRSMFRSFFLKYQCVRDLVSTKINDQYKVYNSSILVNKTRWEISEILINRTVENSNLYLKTDHSKRLYRDDLDKFRNKYRQK